MIAPLYNDLRSSRFVLAGALTTYVTNPESGVIELSSSSLLPRDRFSSANTMGTEA